MTEGHGYTKYRAVLGDGDAREFLIVTVLDTGSVSWTPVSEDAFNDAACPDLPDNLFGQVEAVFGQLQFSDDAEE